MKRARWLAPLAILAVGCGKGDVSQKIAAAGGPQTMHLGLGVNPTTLDPGKVQDIETAGVLTNVFEGLVIWDANNKLQPALAERWDVQDGGKTYVFHLRKDAKFQNGDPVTASDVQYSLERACDPKLASPTAGNYLNDIVGAKAKLAGTGAALTGIKVLDANTISIAIEKPASYFLGKLTYPCASIVSKKAIGTGPEIHSLEQTVGTGPFKIAEFVPQGSLKLTPNPLYYFGAPKLSAVDFIVAKDSQTRLDKFKAGEIVLAGITRTEIASFKADPKMGPLLKLNARPAVCYLALNGLGYAPFKDIRVRRAVAMAIDRPHIVNDILHGVNPIAEGILPPGILGHRDHPASAIPFDLAGAKKLLADAGFPGGKGLPDLPITIRSQTPDAKDVAEVVQDELSKVSIPAKIDEREWGAMLSDRNNNRLGCFVLNWYADYLDPQNFMSTLLTTGAPGNHYGYSNPAVDRLCASADQESDENKRVADYQKAEDLILQDAPWVPIYFVTEAELQSDRVSGLERNLFGDMPFRNVVLK